MPRKPPALRDVAVELVRPQLLAVFRVRRDHLVAHRVHVQRRHVKDARALELLDRGDVRLADHALRGLRVCRRRRTAAEAVVGIVASRVALERRLVLHLAVEVVGLLRLGRVAVSRIVVIGANDLLLDRGRCGRRSGRRFAVRRSRDLHVRAARVVHRLEPGDELDDRRRRRARLGRVANLAGRLLELDHGAVERRHVDEFADGDRRRDHVGVEPVLPGDLPVWRSNAASTWLAVGGRVLPRVAAPAGYDVNTRPPAIVGELVCGSPRNHAHLLLAGLRVDSEHGARLGVEHADAVGARARRRAVVAEIECPAAGAGLRVERVELARVETARGVDLAVVHRRRRHGRVIPELDLEAMRGLLHRGRTARRHVALLEIVRGHAPLVIRVHRDEIARDQLALVIDRRWLDGLVGFRLLLDNRRDRCRGRRFRRRRRRTTTGENDKRNGATEHDRANAPAPASLCRRDNLTNG